MNTKFFVAASAAFLSLGAMAIEPAENKIPALKGDPAGKYAPSSVQTQLQLGINEGTKSVRFIRDNNDPFVVTKAYIIKNADPFILRGVLKTIVSGSLNESPVAVESISYTDGQGAIIVSAEEYRFKDVGNGMSMDQLVAALDKKDLPNSSGTIDMAYFPKYNPARILYKMMTESGMGFTGVSAVDLIKSNSTVAKQVTFNKDGLHITPFAYAGVDDGMNALIMTAPGFDMAEALAFLKAVDTPNPEIQVTYKLVEVYAENDQKLGMDFQSWKNNDGIDLFSVGGKYGSNNLFGYGLRPNTGHTFAEYFNFKPKWNTKYIDFLTTCGKANVVSSGKLIIASGSASSLTISDGFFKVALSKIDDTSILDLLPKRNDTNEIGKKGPDGWYSRQYEQLTNDKTLKKVLEDLKIEHGNYQDIAPAEGHVFELAIGGDVHGKASNLSVSMHSNSLIGWTGDGSPRLTTSDYNTEIQIGSSTKDFVIGGITKSSVVRSTSGIPWLKDLPVIGWLFSSETDTVKNSQYVLIASAELVPVNGGLSQEKQKDANSIKASVDKAVQSPASTLGFEQLLIDNDK